MLLEQDRPIYLFIPQTLTWATIMEYAKCQGLGIQKLDELKDTVWKRDVRVIVM